MAPLVLSIVGVLLVTGAWVHYLSLIPAERVPAEPTAWSVAMAAGAAIGAVGFVLGPTLLDGGMLVVGGGLAGFFFWLLSQRHTPAGALTVAVGDPVPEFAAVDADGSPVGPQNWPGRTLFKLFRGHW